MRLSLIEQENFERADMMHDLCDVSVISLGNSETYKDMKEYFRKRTLPVEELKRIERMNRHVFNADDPKESQRAAMALAALMGPGAVVM